MFTLYLIFTALYAFGYAEPIPGLNPRDFDSYAVMEFITAEASLSQVIPVSEGELVKVMTQNGSLQLQNNPRSWGPPVDIDASPLVRRYVENDEDTACAEHNHVVLGNDVKYNSWGAVCNGAIRHVTCRAYDPAFMSDPTETETSQIQCGEAHLCREDAERTTRFGDRKPTTSCVLSSTISRWVIKGRELGEKCSAKFRYPRAGTGAGRTVKFHTWAWNVLNGVFVELKWMYVKVNGAYVRSASRVPDWTVTYPGIKSTDWIELCGTAWTDTEEVELMGQGTLL